MSKHTPGPWSADLSVRPIIIQSDHLLIADIMTQGRETEHNARLIAAAPKLLAVLEVTTAMLAFEAKCLEDRGEQDKAVPVRGQVEVARAAIKAATSE